LFADFRIFSLKRVHFGHTFGHTFWLITIFRGEVRVASAYLPLKIRAT
jgi:hypothetical protein